METTRFLQLPFHFDAIQLSKELKNLPPDSWTLHFNSRDYEGNWTCISLMGAAGNEESIIVPSDNSIATKPSKFLLLLPSFSDVIASFQAPIISARLMSLHIGAYIKPYSDYNMGYENGTIRIHIPIITNDKVAFILDEKLMNMQEGECWYTNVNYIHSVSNTGETDRIHLVLDLQRNKWTDDLFFSLAPKESFLNSKKEEYDNDTIKKMISELRRSPEPVAVVLIAQLENKLK